MTHLLNTGSLWIETGTMCSGASKNQLEIPNNAGIFFHRNVEDEELTIFIRFPQTHELIEKKLRYHPHNQQWRIYLPTVMQGGYNDYAEMTVRFERTDDENVYIVTPFPNDNQEVRRWKRTSSALGQKRITTRRPGGRKWGWF